MENKLNCRICFKRSIFLKPIINSEIGAALFSISGIKIIDFLSLNGASKICHNCLLKLNAAVGFRDLCRKSDEKHRKLLLDKEVEIWNKNLIELQSNEQKNFELPQIKVEALPINEEQEVQNIIFDEIEIKEEQIEEMPKCAQVFNQTTIEQPRNVKPQRIISIKNVDKVKKAPKTDSKKFYCVICLRKFSQSFELQTHLVDVHNLTARKKLNGHDYSVECLYCDKRFSSHQLVERHFNQYHDDIVQKMICDLCGQICHTRKTMIYHFTQCRFRIKRKKKAPLLAPHPCSVCGKIFNTKCKLTEHERRHQKLEAIFCDFCGNKYRFKRELFYHINERHIKKKRFYCEHCGKSYWKQDVLMKHIDAIHKGIKPYPCSYCDKKFTMQRFLKQHLRMHTGERPYPCRAGCSKNFRYQIDRHRHEQKHSDFKGNFKCSKCNEVFMKKVELHMHYERCTT